MIVDDDGRLLGTVRAQQVLDAIESADRPGAKQPATTGSSGSATGANQSDQQ